MSLVISVLRISGPGTTAVAHQLENIPELLASSEVRCPEVSDGNFEFFCRVFAFIQTPTIGYQLAT